MKHIERIANSEALFVAWSAVCCLLIAALPVAVAVEILSK